MVAPAIQSYYGTGQRIPKKKKKEEFGGGSTRGSGASVGATGNAQVSGLQQDPSKKVKANYIPQDPSAVQAIKFNADKSVQVQNLGEAATTMTQAEYNAMIASQGAHISQPQGSLETAPKLDRDKIQAVMTGEENAKKLSGEPAPQEVSLTPESAEQYKDGTINPLITRGVALGEALTGEYSAAEKFGATIEAIPIGGQAMRFLKMGGTPSEQTDSLMTQIGQQSELAKMDLMKPNARKEVIKRLEAIDELESKIKRNIIISANLRTNPGEIKEMQTKILLERAALNEILNQI